MFRWSVVVRVAVAALMAWVDAERILATSISANSSVAASPPVVFSRRGGTFTEAFTLALSTEGTSTVICYTLDGSLPSATSKVYAAPISVGSTVIVRALSFAPGLLPGPPHTESYLALSNNLFGFSSDLPIVVLHNFGSGAVPDGTQQFANIAVFEPIAGRTSLTNLPTLSVRSGINIRGSSTLFQEKANYRVELWDDLNQGQNYSVLGLPDDNDWILYAPDNFEPVLIHNPFMHTLSRQIGRYSSRTRFVEVYLNTAGGPISQSNYRGVYVLLEKIKRGKNRVDIDALQPDQTQLPEVSGGYILSVDRSASGEGQIYAGGLGLNALDPKWDELVQPQRDPQLQFITQYLDAFYTALNSPKFKDPLLGYPPYVDVDSAIDHHILNVLAFNVDALRLSSYLFKPRSGKLEFGPLWDFDRALGSTDGRDANPRVWRATGGDQGTDYFNSAPIFSNPWYSQMFKDPDFWQRWIDRWQGLRQAQFALTNLHGLIDSLADQVREAQRREAARWPGFTTPRGGSYQAEVDRMKNWLSNRVNFIDTNFLAAPVLDNPGGLIPAGFSLSISALAGSTVYYTLDGTDPRAPGGGVAANAKILTGPITLTTNTYLVARAQDANHRNLTGANRPPLSSPWSGPSSATYVVSVPRLVVSEIMYHPAPAPPGSTNDPEQYEFIELKNTDVKPLDLTGFSFTHGITYTFTRTSAVTQLDSGAYVLLVKNPAAFSSRYPNVTNIAGAYDGNLDNSGERLALEGPLHESILDFSYKPTWYPKTDGLGFSLVVVDEQAPRGSWSDPASWRPSGSLHGTPGRSEPDTSVRIESARIEDGVFVIRFQAAAGTTYSILSTSVLDAPTWSKFIDLSALGVAGEVRVPDPGSASIPKRFFKVISPALP